MFYQRFLQKEIKHSLEHFPSILITGARQCGKSTLAMGLCENYITLDDITVLSLAKTDPVMFISKLKTPVIIDEIQKAPELLSAIKMSIDNDRKVGQFILTGSANIMDFKHVSDTLAGRIALFELSPLSLGEINQSQELFLEAIFKNDFRPSTQKALNEASLLQHMVDGMYPNMITMEEPRMKYLWLTSYISTYIERDIRDIENIRNIDKFAKLIHLLASRSANIINKADLGVSSGLDVKTLDNHLGLLELVYQIKRVRPYYANIGKRFVKSEKLFFTDTGILNFLLGINSIEQLLASTFLGSIFETCVFNELYKQKSFLMDTTSIYYYRTLDKKEIDFIIERNGKIVAIEVKFAKSVSKSDFKHIINLQQSTDTLHAGIVVYMGENALPFGEKLWALPFRMLF